MSFDKRIADVEDNLTPKEAVIYWMREAHRCDSLLTYGRWLMDQPEDAYPLIRLPKQVVAAIRARNKGTPDSRLGDQFYRVQKDVLFLYHLHNQVNLQALQEEETLRLKVTLLSCLSYTHLRAHETKANLVCRLLLEKKKKKQNKKLSQPIK